MERVKHFFDRRKNKYIHTGEKPYSCEQCGQELSQNCNLESHQRSHTGEKPYSCEQCGRAYSTKGSLKTHQRNHTGEKPYLCEHCGMIFSQLSHLQSHQRVHNRDKHYRCEYKQKIDSEVWPRPPEPWQCPIEDEDELAVKRNPHRQRRVPARYC